MSVKVMGMVWDLELDPNKKFVLLAYADHANHNGENIWPAIETVAKKTGYHERSVQRITRELEEAGLLVPDGTGPKGTNKLKIPLNVGGDKIAPLTDCTQMGDIPSGDIPSGDKIAPELTTVSEPSLTPTPTFTDPYWDLAHGKTPKTKGKLEGFYSNAVDAANLIAQGQNADLYELAYAFIIASGILPVLEKSELAYWRKALRNMADNRPNPVTQEHIREAVVEHRASSDKNGRNLILESPKSVQKLAKSIANSPPKKQAQHPPKVSAPANQRPIVSKEALKHE